MATFRNTFRLLATACMMACIFGCAPRDRYVTFSGYAQGGTYTIKINLKGPDGMIKMKTQDILHSIDSILTCIDNSLSGYNRSSIISRFNNGEHVVPDSIFLDIYSIARDFHKETGGQVDIAAGRLFDLWGFGFRNDEFPNEAEVEKIRRSSGMGRLRENMRMALSEDGSLCAKDMILPSDAHQDELPVLNYNAIAQGYSCDLVASFLYSIGVKDMLVDIGEIFCDGLNPSRQPWSIGIDKPVDGNQELGQEIQGIFKAPAGPHGIVTSGNYRKFYVRDGRKFAHSIDPLTGYPVEHSLLSATIVASDATTADAYATYCMVIGLDAAKEFLESRDDLEGCLIYDDNGEFSTWCSEDFTLEFI